MKAVLENIKSHKAQGNELILKRAALASSCSIVKALSYLINIIFGGSHVYLTPGSADILHHATRKTVLDKKELQTGDRG